MTVCVSSAAWKERPHWWQNRTLSGLSALQTGHTIAGYLGNTFMKGIRSLCDSEGPGATWSRAKLAWRRKMRYQCVDDVHPQSRHFARRATREAPRRSWNLVMKPLPETRELLAVAERVVWFKAPAEALAAGVFDARSWAYGSLKCGREPAPPLPVRRGLEPV
jgi:hypothetical protein